MSDKQELNYAAVLPEKGAHLKTLVRAIPVPGPDEILVRNHAIAANPVEWKMQTWSFFIQSYPTVLGSDVSGIITQIGSSVTKFKVGDRVTGFAGVIYNGNADHGAWQTYTLLKEIVTCKIPDFVSFEEGSVIPMAFATSAIALFVDLGIPYPAKTTQQPKPSGLLVWGAASAVGTAAVQLASNFGYKVYATASAKHHEYLKSLGAFKTFDYHDSDVVQQIVASAKSSSIQIDLGFDTVGAGDAPKLAAEVLLAARSTDKAKLALVLPWPGKEPQPEGIEIFQTNATRTSNDKSELGSWLFNDYLKVALENKTIVPSPKIEIVEGGLNAAQKVLDLLKAGVSGKKLVVKVE
ncbi:hypothetical protein BP5796_12062 [Coleophoma crateriformis]|uniref:Enoyl reductase (ER) domain-containing protein n=1 Tax=Coleophoma crateriformis TaxID=565419 RepID=A0A3D8QC07_9HELO|nr:hypothetical protein BP5796_12062 [Coleophoma crateriformis]